MNAPTDRHLMEPELSWRHVYNLYSIIGVLWYRQSYNNLMIRIYSIYIY